MRTSAMGCWSPSTTSSAWRSGRRSAAVLSDRYDLQTALLITACIPVIASGCLLFAGMRYERGRVGSRGVQLSAA